MGVEVENTSELCIQVGRLEEGSKRKRRGEEGSNHCFDVMIIPVVDEELVET